MVSRIVIGTGSNNMNRSKGLGITPLAWRVNQDPTEKMRDYPDNYRDD